MHKTGFVPFFTERDKLGRILNNKGPQEYSGRSNSLQRGQMLRTMWGTKLTRTVKRNAKPKLSIANDLVSWISAGGYGMSPNALSFVKPEQHTNM